MKTTIINAPTQQHGSSLLETMISLFVLAIGLLGTLAMQNKSIQHNQSSYSYSQAIVLAYDISERLKHSGDVGVDLANWQQLVQNQLPQGVGNISGTARGTQQTVTIQFRESFSANLQTINFPVLL
jgi:hypothetical protein